MLGEVKSFSALFVQQTRNGLGEVLQSIKGHMKVEKPGKLRWQTEGVYEQLVVSNGESLWIYDADLEQVSIKDMNNRLAETPALLLGGDVGAIDDDFIVFQQNSASQLSFILQTKDPRQFVDIPELSFKQ